jgi:hypothetical protein
MAERGTARDEAIAALEGGERFPPKFGRTGFRRNFPVSGEWRGRRYAMKQVEACAVQRDGWLVITVLVKCH